MWSYYLLTIDIKLVKLNTDASVLLYDVLKRKKSRYISIVGLNSAALYYFSPNTMRVIGLIL